MTYQVYWLVGPVLALVFPVTWTRVLPGEVSCDWWRAGHVTPVLTSDWSGGHLLAPAPPHPPRPGPPPHQVRGVVMVANGVNEIRGTQGVTPNIVFRETLVDTFSAFVMMTN